MLWIYTHSSFFLLGSKHVCTHGLFSLYPYSYSLFEGTLGPWDLQEILHMSISIVWKAFWWCAYDTCGGQNICQKTTTGMILKFIHKIEAGCVAGMFIHFSNSYKFILQRIWKTPVSLDYNLTYIKFYLHILYNTIIGCLFPFCSYRRSKLVYKEKNKWVIRCVASSLTYLECMKIHGCKYKKQL